MRKIAIALVLLLVAGVAGYFGLDAYARREAERQVGAAFGDLGVSGVDAHHGAVGFDLLRRRLDIADIALVYPGQDGGSTKIGRVTATGLSQPAPGRIKAERIEIKDFAFDGSLAAGSGIEASYRLPLIVIDNYEGPAQVAASGGEPWRVLLAFLQASSAGKVSIPLATAKTQSGAGDTQSTVNITYGAATFDDISAGRIAHITVEPSQFTLKGPEGKADSAATGEFGRVSAEGLDHALMLGLFDDAARSTDDSFRTVYSRISMDGYRIAFDNGLKQQWGAIALDDMAVRPSGVPLAELIAIAQRMQKLQQAGEKADPAELARLFDTLAALYDSVRIGGMTFADMTMNEPDGSKGTLKTMRVGQLTDGRLASITLEGFAGTDASGKPIKLDLLAINGLRPGKLMQLAATGVTDPAALRRLPVQLQALGIVEGIEISGAEVSGGEGDAEPVKLDRLQLSWGDFVGPVPGRIAATLRIAGPIAGLADREPFSLMADSGATRASIALDLGANWNEADKSIVVSPLLAQVSDAFSVSGKLALGGVERDGFTGEPDKAMAAAMGVTLTSAEVTLVDAGIYELKLKQMAEQQGATPEAVRDLFAGLAELMLGQITADRPDLVPAGQAIVAFLREPKGTLTVKATPKTSLPLLDAVEVLQSDPMTLLDEVSIEATTTR